MLVHSRLLPALAAIALFNSASIESANPEDEVDPLRFTPAHQGIARKARVGAQHDAHLGPVAADLGDDALELFNTAGRGIRVGPAQLGGQQVSAAEDEQRPQQHRSRCVADRQVRISASHNKCAFPLSSAGREWLLPISSTGSNGHLC